MSTSEIAPAGEQTLRTGTLRTIDAIAMAIAVLSPAMAMAYNTSGSAAFSGTSTPLAFLIGGIACLSLAVVVVGFTRRMAAAGYAYTYSSRALGQNVGFLTGWMYAFGFFCFVPMTMSGVGGFTSTLIQTEIWKGAPSWIWFPIFLVGMALLVALAVYDIKLSTRTLMVVAAVTIAIVVVVDLIVTFKGGKSGHTLQPFTFGHTLQGGFSGIFYGLIFGVTSFIGFETAAVLGEETRNPRRAIPLSVIVAVLFAIVFYVWTTYVIAIGVGVNDAGSKAWAGDPAVLATVAGNFAGHGFAILVDIAAILSAFIVCTACATAATRTMFAMGREGVLPAWFGRTHPTRKTPANAILFIAGAATVLAAVVGFFWSFGQGPYTNYFLFASIGTIAVTLVYVVLCAGGVAYFRRMRQSYNPLAHLVVPIIGLVIFALAIYGSIYSGAIPDWPYRIVPYANLAWLLAGVGLLLYLRSNRPDDVTRIGSILGEEGGEEAAAVLDQSVPSTAM
ncbi:MAG: APC family permease [Pseudomonadota bacterium]|nr:APC family permease [Pseudomonadota bacterium]